MYKSLEDYVLAMYKASAFYSDIQAAERPGNLVTGNAATVTARGTRKLCTCLADRVVFLESISGKVH